MSYVGFWPDRVPSALAFLIARHGPHEVSYRRATKRNGNQNQNQRTEFKPKPNPIKPKNQNPRNQSQKTKGTNKHQYLVGCLAKRWLGFQEFQTLFFWLCCFCLALLFFLKFCSCAIPGGAAGFPCAAPRAQEACVRASGLAPSSREHKKKKYTVYNVNYREKNIKGLVVSLGTVGNGDSAGYMFQIWYNTHFQSHDQALSMRKHCFQYKCLLFIFCCFNYPAKY